MKGRVLKKIADKFLIGQQACTARGQLKKSGVFVGDIVEFDPKERVIESVYPRKNLFFRPPIANLEKMVIVIAPVPKPDFYLVDKLITFCKKNGVESVLCVNKSDILDEQLKKQIDLIYAPLMKVVYVSAFLNQVDLLRKELRGICAFAGQSAVGKSSLLNALQCKDVEKVGLISKKTERGKQTTRIVSLYELEKDIFIADTAGFSKLDEQRFDMEERELADHFVEFEPFKKSCRFVSCAHINDAGCAVRKAVQEGKISKSRYLSYKKMYAAIKENKVYEKKN